jgi:hypothetical protein
LGGWFEAFDGECLVENDYCDGIRVYNRQCHVGGVSETLISHSTSNVLGPGRRMMLEGRLQLRRGKVRQSITTPARWWGTSRGSSKVHPLSLQQQLVTQSLPVLDARIHVGCWDIQSSKYPPRRIAIRSSIRPLPHDDTEIHRPQTNPPSPLRLNLTLLKGIEMHEDPEQELRVYSSVYWEYY